jgi:hypothetical protein
MSGTKIRLPEIVHNTVLIPRHPLAGVFEYPRVLFLMPIVGASIGVLYAIAEWLWSKT